MVERCQTSHLPDPYDPTLIKQGIGVYYTSLIVGGVDFAVIEDRKFKSGPKGKIPQNGPRPDHIRDPNYNPESVNVKGLELLGNRQLDFFNQWGERNEDKIKLYYHRLDFVAEPIFTETKKIGCMPIWIQTDGTNRKK